jgi:hypothetical protein
VDGPVYKTGNTAFTFPLGKNNAYAPVSITAPSLVTDAFRAQYFSTPPHDAGYDTTQHDLSLHHLSRREYFILDRTNGTATPKVTLSWKTIRSGVVDVLGDLRVARWNGSTWKDEGNGGTAGTNAEGTIQSLNNISNFSPFTLASTTVNNPLPVNFISFNVTLLANNTVFLTWKTSNEINNARFEVERSTDSRNWIKLSELQPQSSHEYEYTDNTVTDGIYFYQIKQVDINGHYKYSMVRMIRVNRDHKILIWPNPVTDNLYVQFPYTKGSLEITDMNGRIVRREIITNMVTTVPVQQLARGLYVITIRYDGTVLTEKFMKQ